MKNNKLRISVILLACAFIGFCAGFLGSRLWLAYRDGRVANFNRECRLYVYPDYTLEQVRDSIVKLAEPRSIRSLDRSLKKECAQLQPGLYVIDTKVSSRYVARMLNFGWQTPQNLTFSGTIRTRGRVAKIIGSQMMVDSAAVAKALTDNEFLANYGVDSVDFFTIILPDTYSISWTSSMDEIFSRLRREYDAWWTEERVAKARAQGLTPYEASIMASIVQGETRKKDEYPVIAAVYLNRFHKGMKLQADPTICYIFGYTLNRVRLKHLEAISPYNTYMHAGLPPTPINSPSKDCLEAVLNPDTHDYLFFCASPAFDGSHRFAVTYQEHLKNAREFQKALNARSK